MPALYIKCPQTGKDVNTGMAMDEKSFTTTELKNNYVQCPHCKKVHKWDKKDSYFKTGN